MLLFYRLIAAVSLLFIAPQRKKQKEHEKMLASLQSGDKVLTNGGIYGVVTNVKEDRFIVRIADNTKIEVAKGFISAVTRRAEPRKRSKRTGTRRCPSRPREGVASAFHPNTPILNQNDHAQTQPLEDRPIRSHRGVGCF